MIHPDTELRDAGRDVGLGVFATRRIPCGTIVWVRDALDRCLPLEEVRAMPLRYRKLLDRYGFLEADGNRIFCWDFGRFVNHSCAPNVLPTPWRFEIAVRTIHAGEQVTNDYSTLNLERAFHCRCGSGQCRRRVRPGDFERFVDDWDERVGAALPNALAVDQPLSAWLDPRLRRKAQRASQRPELIPSIASIRLEAARHDPLAFAAVPRARRRRSHGDAEQGSAPHDPAFPAVERSAENRTQVAGRSRQSHLTRSARDRRASRRRAGAVRGLGT